MNRREKDFRVGESEVVGVRVPKRLAAEAKEVAKRQDLTLSQLIRRALKTEVGWTEVDFEAAKR